MSIELRFELLSNLFSTGYWDFIFQMKGAKSNKANKLKTKFSVGDKVLAGDKGSYYEAKILKCESMGNSFKYFIHYLTWDRKFDTWLDEALVEPYSSSNLNLKLAKSITKSNNVKIEKTADTEVVKIKDEPASVGQRASSRKALIADANSVDNHDTSSLESSTLQSKKRLSSSQYIPTATVTASTTSSSSSKISINTNTVETVTTNHTIKKAKKELSSADLVQDEDEDSFPIKFNIPCDLKKHMVDEWVIITQESDENNRLLKLPCSNNCTVKSIIQAFLEEKKVKLDKSTYKWTNELILGILRYFDEALPRILLYRQERQQYDDLMKLYPHLTPCSLYGGEHLLRLFVRLPRLLSLVFLPANDTQNIQLRLNELLKFLHKHSTEYVNIHHYVSAASSLDTSNTSSSSSSSSTSSSSVKLKAKVKG